MNPACSTRGEGTILLAGAKLGRLAALDLALTDALAARPLTTEFSTTISGAAMLLETHRWLLIIVDDTFEPPVRHRLPAILRAVPATVPLLLASCPPVVADVLTSWALPPNSSVSTDVGEFDTLARLAHQLCDRPHARPAWGTAVRRATAYLAEHYGEGATVSLAAAAGGRSPEHLARSFVRDLGVLPSDYIRLLRTAVARHLMTRTSRSLDDIAEAAGFHDASHLRRVFRRTTGQPPSYYRTPGAEGASPAEGAVVRRPLTAGAPRSRAAATGATEAWPTVQGRGA